MESVKQSEWLIQRFEENRTHMRAIAYRLLGSVNEAEDAVQEVWIRLIRSDTSDVENLGGWLTTVVSRVCLDMLRARASRREESIGERAPEPVGNRQVRGDPEQETLLADSVCRLRKLQTFLDGRRYQLGSLRAALGDGYRDQLQPPQAIWLHRGELSTPSSAHFVPAISMGSSPCLIPMLSVVRTTSQYPRLQIERLRVRPSWRKKRSRMLRKFSSHVRRSWMALSASFWLLVGNSLR